MVEGDAVGHLDLRGDDVRQVLAAERCPLDAGVSLVPVGPEHQAGEGEKMKQSKISLMKRKQ